MLVLVLCAAASARAEPADDIVGRPLVLDRHQLEARLVVEIDTYPGEIGVPLSIAPDVWFGVASRWTVGLVHSYASLDRMEAGSTFCVVQSAINPANVCTATYRGSGLDARYLAFDRGAWSIAPRARLLYTRDSDPATNVTIDKPSLVLGALARWRHGRISIWADPYLQLGLANRTSGNADALALPLYVAVQPMRRWAVWSEVGYYSQIDNGHDATSSWYGILAFGTTVNPVAGLDVGAVFGWQSLFGPQDNAKATVVLVTIGWRTSPLF